MNKNLKQDKPKDLYHFLVSLAPNACVTILAQVRRSPDGSCFCFEPLCTDEWVNDIELPIDILRKDSFTSESDSGMVDVTTTDYYEKFGKREYAPALEHHYTIYIYD